MCTYYTFIPHPPILVGIDHFPFTYPPQLTNTTMLLNQACAIPFSPSHFPRPAASFSHSIFSNSISMHRWRGKNLGAVSAIPNEQSSNANAEKRRNVVEHICLLEAKENITEEEEKDMLDYLYTSQYQTRGVLAISLGRIRDRDVVNYTHAVYIRFQTKESLTNFYTNPFYDKVLKEHINPYCHGLIDVDYESEVEDDILPIFRKGEEFSYGIEFVLLIEFLENAFDQHVKDALESFDMLISEFPSLIVQTTKGSNFNLTSKEDYTHAIVIRFRSIDAYEIFIGSSAYKDIWRSKFQPFVKKRLAVQFSVDPVSTEIM